MQLYFFDSVNLIIIMYVVFYLFHSFNPVKSYFDIKLFVIFSPTLSSFCWRRIKTKRWLFYSNKKEPTRLIRPCFSVKLLDLSANSAESFCKKCLVYFEELRDVEVQYVQKKMEILIKFVAIWYTFIRHRTFCSISSSSYATRINLQIKIE